MTLQLPNHFLGLSKRVVAAGLLLTILCASPISGTAASEGEQTWQMATRNADIQEFVAQVAKITG